MSPLFAVLSLFVVLLDDVSLGDVEQLRFTAKLRKNLSKPRNNATEDRCLSVSECGAKCGEALDARKIPQPLLLKSLDVRDSHLSCCESGCYRRTGHNESECIQSCHHSPWVEDLPLSSDSFDQHQSKRSFDSRFPTEPTFVQLGARVSARSGRLSTVASSRLSVSTPPSAPPQPAPETDEELDSIEFFKKAIPKNGVPADVLDYLRKKQELRKLSGHTSRAEYLTDEERRQNTGRYHRDLCILGCQLRCPLLVQDDVRGPVEMGKSKQK